MWIRGKNGTYEVLDLVAKSKYHRTRLCTHEDNVYLLRITTDAVHNHLLARNAFILSKLKEYSASMEEEYSKKHDGNLNYDLAFPYVVDDFIYHSQGARQVNVLGFKNVDSVSQMIPLSRFRRDRIRPDLPSSAWIFGKLLKTLHFAHQCAVAGQSLKLSNLLIEPSMHYIVVYDWSDAGVHSDGIRPSLIKEEIKEAAQSIITLLGDDLESVCVDEFDQNYVNFLQHLATHGMSNAQMAHEGFYKTVDELCYNPLSYWESGFHDFVTFNY